MRNEITLTDDQIMDAFADAFGAWPERMSQVTLTRETIADFLSARASYAEAGVIGKQDAEALLIERAQVAAGQTRKNVHVLDFGTVRAVYVQNA